MSQTAVVLASTVSAIAEFEDAFRRIGEVMGSVSGAFVKVWPLIAPRPYQSGPPLKWSATWGAPPQIQGYRYARSRDWNGYDLVPC